MFDRNESFVMHMREKEMILMRNTKITLLLHQKYHVFRKLQSSL